MNRRFAFILLLFVSTLVSAWRVDAETVDATFNVTTDVTITANGYTATGNTINFTLNFAPPTGTNLMVVNNTGLPFIQGTFDNLVQGQTVVLSYGGLNYNFVANYYGGNGNDLVLQWAGVRLMAWGYNNQNQLGDGTTLPRPVPTAVNAAGVLSGKSVIGLAGPSMALCADGTIAAWGYNGEGQLGNGTTTNSAVPVAVNISGVLAGKRVIAVSNTGTHALALCSDGTLAAWGSNGLGELGNGSFTSSTVPVLVNTAGALAGKTVISVKSAGSSSYALCADGTLVAWGSNNYGQLGTGSTNNSPVPVAVNTSGALSGRTVISFTANGEYCTAVCSDGTLVSWGNNSSGQLGFISQTTFSPTLVPTAGTALDGKTVVAVEAGALHSVALCSDGTIAAWGSNDYGQMGNNKNSSFSLPVQVDATGVLLGEAVTVAAAGYNFSLALCADGSAATWGYNTDGELGNGNTTSNKVPVSVSTISLISGERIVAASVSGKSTLALVASPLSPRIVLQQPAGTSLSSGVSTVNFGDSSIGTGVPRTFTILNSGSMPLNISSVTVDGAKSGDFVVTSSPATSLPVGASTTLEVTFTPSARFLSTATLHILSDDPYAVNFTVNLQGNSPGTLTANFSSSSDVPLTTDAILATGSQVNFSLNNFLPTGIDLTVISNTGTSLIQGNFSNLAQGQTVSLNYGGYRYDFIANYYGGSGNDLVLQWANRRVMAWGSNIYGQFGSGGTVSSKVPVNASNGTMLGGSILSMMAGNNHGLAFLSNGKVAAWGDNTSGQLGNGGTTASTSPVGVALTKTPAAVAAGVFHNMVLYADGTVACWGGGLPGNGSLSGSLTPVLVSTTGVLSGKSVVAVAAGDSHSLVLCSDGTMATWGDNNYRQLGDGSVNSQAALPVAVIPFGVLSGKKVVAIAAGGNHNLALCSDNTLVAWGSNTDGQLGNNGVVDSNVPVLVDTSGALSGKTIVSIAAGNAFSLAFCSDGTVAAWGDNSYSQLGPVFGDSKVPVTAPTSTGALAGKTIKSLSAGYSFTLASCSDGTLAGWGRDLQGELGDNGPNGTTAMPVSVLQTGLSGGEVFTQAVSGVDAYNSFGFVAVPPTPQITVKQPSGAALTKGSTFGFGRSPVGSGLPLTFTIQNSGSAPLNIAAVTITGANASEFAVTTPPAVSIGSGDSSTFVLTFTAGGVLDRSAVLSIASNDPTAASFNLNLTGVGTGALAAVYNSAADVPATTSDLTGDSVNFTLNFAPSPGANLTVVKNNGQSFLKGSFDNLAQGQLVVLNFGGVNYGFVANYYGGAGRDLVLQWAARRLLAWGSNDWGQLGNDSNDPSSAVPVAVTATGVLSGKTVTGFAAGAFHSLAVSADGAVFSWGSNLQGQLGFFNAGSPTSVPITVSTTGTLSGKILIAVGAGDNHSLALSSDGKVFAWGDNSKGQVGNNGDYSLEPAAVSTAGTPLSGATVTAVAAGRQHSVALRSDGIVATWGNNQVGNLGNNSMALTSSVPVAVFKSGVLLGKFVSAIAAGADHNLALCSDGTLVAWGDNSLGQLGNGGTGFSRVPVAVSTTGALSGKTVTAVAAGAGHSLVLCSDGKVVSWGGNSYGQLGINSTTDSHFPATVISSGALAGKVVSKIWAVQNSSFALCSDGTLVAWGANGGMFGDGSSALRLVPVAINLSALPAGELIGASVSSEGANHVLGVAVDPPSPSIAPLSATNITVNSATLKSTVNPNSNSTSASFQYGLDTSYGSTTPPQDVGSGVSLVMLSAPISDLTPHTMYHFRAVADNAAGNGGGADATFMTQDTFPVANADRVDHVAGPVIISVRANDTDADGDSLSITGITQGTSGSVSTDGNTVTYNPGASFSSSDTFTYTISDGFGGTAVGTVTVNAAPLQSWRVQTFGTNAGDSSVAGDNADPNQNGIPNLMEYALHGDALGNGTGAAILPQASKDVSQHLQLVFTRYADRNDVTLTVQGADSPGGPWTDLAQSVNGGVFSAIAGGATVSENSGSGGFAVTVGDIYATTDPAHPRRFMRLQVTRP